MDTMTSTPVYTAFEQFCYLMLYIGGGIAILATIGVVYALVMDWWLDGHPQPADEDDDFREEMSRW